MALTDMAHLVGHPPAKRKVTFNSKVRHMHGVQTPFPVGAGGRGKQLMFLSHIQCFSPSLSLSPIYLFLNRGEGREKERERNVSLLCERETSICFCLSYVPHWTEPTTQACTLAGNQTGDLRLCGPTPNQLSHAGQGNK